MLSPRGLKNNVDYILQVCDQITTPENNQYADTIQCPSDMDRRRRTRKYITSNIQYYMAILL
jgi:hypothetical protein